jgi:hypothetical protein
MLYNHSEVTQNTSTSHCSKDQKKFSARELKTWNRQSYVNSVSIFPDGSKLVIGGRDDKSVIVDIATHW